MRSQERQAEWDAQFDEHSVCPICGTDCELMFVDEWGPPSNGATDMLLSIRATLKARAEGHNEGGDSVIMGYVDQIVQRESNFSIEASK